METTAEEYEEIIRGKTAWLIRASCQLGALRAGADDARVEAAAAYGENIGMAFQIVDDALDFAPQSITGKPSGGDVREGKLTPPLRMYRDSLDDAARAAFDQAFNDASFTDGDAGRIADSIRAAGFDQATRMAAEGYLDKARAAPGQPALGTGTGHPATNGRLRSRPQKIIALLRRTGGIPAAKARTVCSIVWKPGFMPTLPIPRAARRRCICSRHCRSPLPPSVDQSLHRGRSGCRPGEPSGGRRHLARPHPAAGLAGAAALRGTRPHWIVEVGYRPGVTDNEGRTARDTAAMVLGIARDSLRVYTSVQYRITCTPDRMLGREEVEALARDLLCNTLIQRFRVKSAEEWQAKPGFEAQAARVTGESNDTVDVVPLSVMDDEALQKASRDNTWALTLRELHCIRDQFATPGEQARRKAAGLPADPTDVEMEVLAQTWSGTLQAQDLRLPHPLREQGDRPERRGQQPLQDLHP